MVEGSERQQADHTTTKPFPLQYHMAAPATQLLLCMGSDPLRTLLLLIWASVYDEDADGALFFFFLLFEFPATSFPLDMCSSFLANSPRSVLSLEAASSLLLPWASHVPSARMLTQSRRTMKL